MRDLRAKAKRLQEELRRERDPRKREEIIAQIEWIAEDLAELKEGMPR